MTNQASAVHTGRPGQVGAGGGGGGCSSVYDMRHRPSPLSPCGRGVGGEGFPFRETPSQDPLSPRGKVMHLRRGGAEGTVSHHHTPPLPDPASSPFGPTSLTPPSPTPPPPTPPPT